MLHLETVAQMRKLSSACLARLAAFTKIYTCDKVEAQPVVQAFLEEVAAEPGRSSETELFQRLYRRLRPLMGEESISFPAWGPRMAFAGMRGFSQLSPHQRAASFLVIGCNLTPDEAATILGRSAAQVEMELVASFLMLEHVIPEEEGAPAEEKVKRESLSASMDMRRLQVSRAFRRRWSELKHSGRPYFSAPTWNFGRR